MKLVISSRNQKKIRELREIFCDVMQNGAPELLSLDDVGFEANVEENGNSFEQNALIKARAVYDFCKLPVFADDSGLCVDALNGAPGIYSARYAGQNAGDDENTNKLLDALKGVSDRSCRFVCVVAYIDKGGHEQLFRGECHGVITDKKIGDNGFGYDPVFYLPEYQKTFAQLDGQLKNRISHRAVAMKKFAEKIKEEIEQNAEQ